MRLKLSRGLYYRRKSDFIVFYNLSLDYIKLIKFNYTINQFFRSESHRLFIFIIHDLSPLPNLPTWLYFFNLMFTKTTLNSLI